MWQKKTYCPRRDIPIQISIDYSSTCVICVCVCCVLCVKQYLLIKYIILWNKESHFFVTLKEKVKKKKLNTRDFYISNWFILDAMFFFFQSLKYIVLWSSSFLYNYSIVFLYIYIILSIYILTLTLFTLSLSQNTIPPYTPLFCPLFLVWLDVFFMYNSFLGQYRVLSHDIYI